MKKFHVIPDGRPPESDGDGMKIADAVVAVPLHQLFKEFTSDTDLGRVSKAVFEMTRYEDVIRQFVPGYHSRDTAFLQLGLGLLVNDGETAYDAASHFCVDLLIQQNPMLQELSVTNAKVLSNMASPSLILATATHCSWFAQPLLSLIHTVQDAALEPISGDFMPIGALQTTIEDLLMKACQAQVLKHPLREMISRCIYSIREFHCPPYLFEKGIAVGLLRTLLAVEDCGDIEILIHRCHERIQCLCQDSSCTEVTAIAAQLWKIIECERIVLSNDNNALLWPLLWLYVVYCEESDAVSTTRMQSLILSHTESSLNRCVERGIDECVVAISITEDVSVAKRLVHGILDLPEPIRLLSSVSTKLRAREQQGAHNVFKRALKQIGEDLNVEAAPNVLHIYRQLNLRSCIGQYFLDTVSE